jgi:hypothetical protein
VGDTPSLFVTTLPLPSRTYLPRVSFELKGVSKLRMLPGISGHVDAPAVYKDELSVIERADSSLRELFSPRRTIFPTAMLSLIINGEERSNGDFIASSNGESCDSVLCEHYRGA